MNFLIEVSTSFGQMTKYLCLDCESTQEAIDRIVEHYEDMMIEIPSKAYRALEAHNENIGTYISEIIQIGDESVYEVCDSYPHDLMN